MPPTRKCRHYASMTVASQVKKAEAAMYPSLWGRLLSRYSRILYRNTLLRIIVELPTHKF